MAAAGIMAFMMLLLVLVSSFYLAKEANHHCSGHDCPVCACMQQCENTLRRIGDGVMALAVVLIPVLFVLFTAALPAKELPHNTPISEKVRLNN